MSDKYLLDPRITRRDFMNATLLGSGAALMGACKPPAQELIHPWNGYGGVSEYRFSNGNTQEVMDAAHHIRDQVYGSASTNVVDTGETYDLVIVGGGFSGLGALHEFRRAHPRGSCLLLENHGIFGGFARPNEFDVDGYRIAGPQASLNFIMPETEEDRANNYWDELGLPHHFEFAERLGGDPAIKFARSTSAPLYLGEQSATVGYHFAPAGADGRDQWVRDIWRDDLKRTPWPSSMRDGMLTLRALKRQGRPTGEEAIRLDGMTFEDYATRELGLDPGVLSYVTMGMCITGPQISAYAARSLPGMERFAEGSPGAKLADRFISFPGGNTVLARHFVKAALPEAIKGPRTFEAIAFNPIDFAALDRPGSNCRMRLRSTVVKVAHEGAPETASIVNIVYEKGGKLHRVRAKGVVVAIGSWVAKHIVADLPAERRSALDQFLYSPMLMANVALRNWRFLDKLGISAARWFDGLGFYSNVRQPMMVGENAPPFHPDKPIVMTFYIPFPAPDMPLEMQGPAGRAQLFATTYAEYEAMLVKQMQRLFAPGGFDARRDIAGIVLNRWGHAFETPPPGFFFGKDGKAAPQQIARLPFGRIAFGESGDWLSSAKGGKRVVETLSGVV